MPDFFMILFSAVLAVFLVLMLIMLAVAVWISVIFAYQLWKDWRNG